MSILRELGTNNQVETDTKDEYQYVIELKERLTKTWELAHKSLGSMAGKYKKYYDLKSKPRKLKVGDKVLVLLPTDQNKLLIQWKGPYKVVEVKYENDYIIDMDGAKKLFHINLLKLYYDREQEVAAGCFETVVLPEQVSNQQEPIETDRYEDVGVDEVSKENILCKPLNFRLKK